MSNRKATCVLFTILTFVAGCATQDYSGWPGGQSERRAERLAENGQFDDSASVYIGLASGATGQERDRLTLLAVEQWLNAGDARRARSAMLARGTEREARRAPC